MTVGTSLQKPFIGSSDLRHFGIKLQEEEISFTGETVTPTGAADQFWREHASRYRFAGLFATGASVLDVGCGIGYGTEIMAQSAKYTVGLDESSESIEHTRTHSSHADYLCGSTTAFPVASGAFDLVTAFEVIKHVEGRESLLREALRVLTPDGVFLVSMSNLNGNPEARGSSGLDSSYVQVFSLGAFRQSLHDVFPWVRILAQNRQECIAFSGDWSNEQVAAFIPAATNLADANELVAVCSRVPVQIPFFVDSSIRHHLLWERERHLSVVMGELDEMRNRHAALAEKHSLNDQNLRSVNEKLQAVLQENLQLKNALTTDIQAFDALLAEHQAVRNSSWIRLGRILGLGPWSRRFRSSPGREKSRLNAAVQ